MAKLIGTAPNQVPTNGDLGSMAFEDRNNYITKGASVHQPFRNIIINGDMSIHQRGTNVTANNGFGVDRFLYNESANFDERVFTFGQDTDVPTGQGFAKSMKVNVTTPETTIASDEYARIMTRFEGQNLQHLKYGTSKAESITLSFWLKTNVTGNFAVSLFQDNDSRIIGTTYSATSSGVWEKITITFAGDTTGIIDNNNSSGLRVMFILDAGSSFTSSDNTSWGSYSNSKLGYGQTASVFGTTSGYWNVTGVQLEVGTSASDFEFLPYDVNYQRCIRYCNALLNYGAGDVNNNRVYNADYANGNGMARMSYPRMRNQPSITYTLVNATGLSNDFSSNGLIQLHAGDNNFYIHSILLEAEL